MLARCYEMLLQCYVMLSSVLCDAVRGDVPASARPGVGGVILGLGSSAGGARAMDLAERVSSTDQRDGLAVIHCHSTKGIADLARGDVGQRVAVWT
jgi:hypothetical protein